MGKMAKENPDPSFKEARVAGIKNKLRRLKSKALEHAVISFYHFKLT